jgi:hypothetical protein
MQAVQQALVAVETQAIVAAPVAPSVPVELPLDQLQQIAGGTPKGTW